MPSVSKKQANLMSAIAHGWNPPMKHAPSLAVAKEFHEADKRVGKWEHAEGGKVQNLQRLLDWMASTHPYNRAPREGMFGKNSRFYMGLLRSHDWNPRMSSGDRDLMTYMAETTPQDMLHSHASDMEKLVDKYSLQLQYPLVTYRGLSLPERPQEGTVVQALHPQSTGLDDELAEQFKEFSKNYSNPYATFLKIINPEQSRLLPNPLSGQNELLLPPGQKGALTLRDVATIKDLVNETEEYVAHANRPSYADGGKVNNLKRVWDWMMSKYGKDIHHGMFGENTYGYMAELRKRGWNPPMTPGHFDTMMTLAASPSDFWNRSSAHNDMQELFDRYGLNLDSPLTTHRGMVMTDKTLPETGGVIVSSKPQSTSYNPYKAAEFANPGGLTSQSINMAKRLGQTPMPTMTEILNYPKTRLLPNPLSGEDELILPGGAEGALSVRGVHEGLIDRTPDEFVGYPDTEPFEGMLIDAAHRPLYQEGGQVQAPPQQGQPQQPPQPSQPPIAAQGMEQQDITPLERMSPEIQRQMSNYLQQNVSQRPAMMARMRAQKALLSQQVPTMTLPQMQEGGSVEIPEFKPPKVGSLVHAHNAPHVPASPITRLAQAAQASGVEQALQEGGSVGPLALGGDDPSDWFAQREELLGPGNTITASSFDRPRGTQFTDPRNADEYTLNLIGNAADRAMSAVGIDDNHRQLSRLIATMAGQAGGVDEQGHLRMPSFSSSKTPLPGAVSSVLGWPAEIGQIASAMSRVPLSPIESADPASVSLHGLSSLLGGLYDKYGDSMLGWSKAAADKAGQAEIAARRAMGLTPAKGIKEKLPESLGYMLAQIPVGEAGAAKSLLSDALTSGLEFLGPTIRPSTRNYLKGTAFGALLPGGGDDLSPGTGKWSTPGATGSFAGGGQVRNVPAAMNVLESMLRKSLARDQQISTGASQTSRGILPGPAAMAGGGKVDMTRRAFLKGLGATAAAGAVGVKAPGVLKELTKAAGPAGPQALKSTALQFTGADGLVRLVHDHIMNNELDHLFPRHDPTFDFAKDLAPGVDKYKHVVKNQAGLTRQAMEDLYAHYVDTQELPPRLAELSHALAEGAGASMEEHQRINELLHGMATQDWKGTDNSSGDLFNLNMQHFHKMFGDEATRDADNKVLEMYGSLHDIGYPHEVQDQVHPHTLEHLKTQEGARVKNMVETYGPGAENMGYESPEAPGHWFPEDLEEPEGW